MCDTLVALGNSTADGSVIFAKNSDREPNEAHELVVVPRSTHAKGSMLRCTYLEIPQVEQTHAVLLSKPAWMWGAEMGANEYGVAIGNEAVFTKVPQEKKPALTGMDLLRLALERAAGARAALDTITSLLERFGQGGNCGYTHPFYYHNSFLIADPHEAWVLETAGRQWAAEKVKDIRTISNAITIGSEWDLASPGLVDYALERGWCKRRADFHFGRCYSDFVYTRLGESHARQCRSTDRLRPQSKSITVKTMIDILRDHGSDRQEDISLRQGILGADICMHAGYGPVRNSQTTGSMASRLSAEGQVHWVTGTSAPCTGIFKPVWLDAGLPEVGLSPGRRYDPAHLWWRHEALHREVLRDYETRLALYSQERNELEAGFFSQAERLQGSACEERASFTARCFEQADRVTEDWRQRVRSQPVANRSAFLYRLAWKRFSRQAGFEEAAG